MTYFVEVTDTFGCELNYCWVDRYKIAANSIPHALAKLSKHTGRHYRSRYTDGDGILAFFRAKDACIGGTVEIFDTDYHSNYNVTEL